MSKKKIIIVLGVFLILGIFSAYKYVKKPLEVTKSEKEVHYHAGFIVFNKSQRVDFSDSKYMFIKPCSVDGKETSDPATEQMEKAHLHDGVGDVVHVEADGAKWGDLFDNINFVPDKSNITAYLNGVKQANFWELPISAYDSLVVYIGEVDLKLLSQAVTEDRIKSVEGKSVECGR